MSSFRRVSLAMRDAIAAGLLVGCAGDIEPENVRAHRTSASEVNPFRLMIPTTGPPAHTDSSSAACGSGAGPKPHLSNAGGQILSHATVYNVFWGAVADMSRLNQYMGWLVGSYTGLLTEYGVSSGSFAVGLAAGSNPTATIADADVRNLIAQLVNQGKLPESDSSLFVVWLPPGTTIKTNWGNGDQSSCREFCAYHSSYLSQWIFGHQRRYAVIPDLTSCDGACGWQGDDFDDRTLAASHEVAESLTDPDPDQTWYDGQPSYQNDSMGKPIPDGEIGDICNQQAYRSNGYAVQCLWSNKQNGCVN